MEERADRANKPTRKFQRQLDRITEAWTEALERPRAADLLRIAVAEGRNLTDRRLLDEEQRARCLAAIEDVVQTLTVASPEVIAMLGTSQVRVLLAESVGFPMPPATKGNLRLRSVAGVGELHTLLGDSDVAALRKRLAARQVWLNVTDLDSTQFRDQWPAISYQ